MRWDRLNVMMHQAQNWQEAITAFFMLLKESSFGLRK